MNDDKFMTSLPKGEGERTPGRVGSPSALPNLEPWGVSERNHGSGVQVLPVELEIVARPPCVALSAVIASALLWSKWTNDLGSLACRDQFRHRLTGDNTE